LDIREFVGIAVLGVCASAQTFRGNLGGALTDPSEAVIPEASVQLHNASTGAARVSNTERLAQSRSGNRSTPLGRLFFRGVLFMIAATPPADQLA
jgi:hypothetical protein